MNELRNLAREGPIANFIDEPPPSLAFGVMSGVSLRVNEQWLLWHWYQQYVERATVVHGSQRAARVHHGYRYDFSKTPFDWGNHCIDRNLPPSAHPVEVVVILRDQPVDGMPDDWPRLVGDHPVVYEYRPEARLQAAPGDSIAGTTSGTLGGFLWRPSTGQHFAVSCAHVFGQTVGASVYAGRTCVGSVIESYFPPSAVGKCNNRIQGPVSQHNVDVAVADVALGTPAQISIPGIGKPTLQTSIAQIGQGDFVTFRGAASNTLSAKVKECNIWKELTFQGNKYCFGDLLVIEDVTYHYVASQFTNAGDSGAWIVNTLAGIVGWDAMLIAGDGANTYCVYSENIMAMIDPTLSLPP